MIPLLYVAARGDESRRTRRVNIVILQRKQTPRDAEMKDLEKIIEKKLQSVITNSEPHLRDNISAVFYEVHKDDNSILSIREVWT